MKIGEQLFILIHQLQKGEKRAFKLYLNKHSNINSSLVFDTLNKMKVYDEQVFKQSLKGKIEMKHLSFEKYRLKKVLFNALADLWYNNSEELSLGNIINKIELGLKYKLVKITKEWIDKGYEYAEQQQDPLTKVLILQFELSYTVLINAPLEARIELSEMQKKILKTIEVSKETLLE